MSYLQNFGWMRDNLTLSVTPAGMKGMVLQYTERSLGMRRGGAVNRR
ncbi:MAG: hypothetical protein Q9M31_04950 [Mariprofundus sp.]|nr:hypothetical protein [Mariprofundus sp.]